MQSHINMADLNVFITPKRWIVWTETLLKMKYSNIWSYEYV